MLILGLYATENCYRGTTDTFTEFGALQFVMTSKFPWSDFEQLKRFLAKENPPYNRFSGDYSKMNDICEKLFSENLIEEEIMS
jgi:hypothetical protein